jgi:hypothetical protein
MEELKAVTELLHGDGIPMLGRELSDEDAIASVRQRFVYGSYCLVRQWIWIDLVMPDAVLEDLKRSGRQPVMLYAHEVVSDSQRRFHPGEWVRSTPLVVFSDGCFFQTRNTVYVLLGKGIRKSAELSTVFKVF